MVIVFVIIVFCIFVLAEVVFGMLGGGIGGIILFFIVIGVGEGEGDDGEGFLEVIWLGVDGFVFDGDIEVL